MWHELAEKLGGFTVRELKQRMTSREFTEWKIYMEEKEKKVPSVDGWLMKMLAQVCLVIARGNGAKKAKIEDFMLHSKHSRERRMESDQIENMFKHWRLCNER